MLATEFSVLSAKQLFQPPLSTSASTSSASSPEVEVGEPLSLRFDVQADERIWGTGIFVI